MSLQIQISLKMQSSGKLIKTFISICPTENLLVLKAKATHSCWNGWYTTVRHTSTSWIIQHKHQHFITRQEWTISCQDSSCLQYGHCPETTKLFVLRLMSNITSSQPSRSCVIFGYSKEENPKARANICICLVLELMMPDHFTADIREAAVALSATVTVT